MSYKCPTLSIWVLRIFWDIFRCDCLRTLIVAYIQNTSYFTVLISTVYIIEYDTRRTIRDMTDSGGYVQLSIHHIFMSKTFIFTFFFVEKKRKIARDSAPRNKQNKKRFLYGFFFLQDFASTLFKNCLIPAQPAYFRPEIVLVPGSEIPTIAWKFRPLDQKFQKLHENSLKLDKKWQYFFWIRPEVQSLDSNQ